MANAIGWCDRTWNPCTGCTPVSEACEHCYAERMAYRFSGGFRGGTACLSCPEGEQDEEYIGHQFGEACYRDIVTCMRGVETLDDGKCIRPWFTPTFHPDRLDKPLHWRKPRRIFVCSMSDLFHEAFTDEQIAMVCAEMYRAPQHTYLILTKRPERMRTFFTSDSLPMPHNWWLGVTAENQQRADERIPILLDTPAAVRFISVEPMLEAVDLSNVAGECLLDGDWTGEPREVRPPGLDWVIVGGETGPGARPMQPEWALDVYRQCKAAGTAFWWKQGGRAFDDRGLDGVRMGDVPDYWDMLATRELPGVRT